MKYLKLSFFIFMPILFVYIIINLNSSITSLSDILFNFFKTLFPYLFIFLIINQILIKTNLINLLGYILQFILYPIFKINAKNCSLLLLSLLNGFPSSVLYFNIMKKNDNYHTISTNIISSLFFLPSFTFVFYIIKNNLASNIFLYFAISLYLPAFIVLLINRYKSTDKYITFFSIKKDLKISFINFKYINALKDIFLNSILTLINILGMITFYSIINLLIPYPIINGLFEFSMPSLNILSSQYNDIIKTLFLLIIMSFSSLSSISQAAIYFEDLNIHIFSFIKTRIVMLSLSLLTLTILLFTFL